jgi:diketogulonate reductase-like aldo/keto reductase
VAHAAQGEVQGVPVPGFMYGTAWKEDDTRRLTALALDAGFRAIDTANQRKHYHEAGVGEALQAAIADGLVRREDVFLQTKFTHQAGQDHRLPYDPSAAPAEQVRQSFARSLEHLGVDRLDSYVLHGPSQREGWSDEDLEVWSAMEELHAAGKTRLLGVSNVSLGQLRALCDRAQVAPAFVQNRCYASRGWGREVRALCRERGVVYQGFSLLTANRTEVASAPIQDLARRLDRTPQQVVFAFARQVGMLPLTGTSDPEHMRQDLAARDLELDPADVSAIEAISG